jgi:integrase
MRPRFQTGTIVRRGQHWTLRYSERHADRAKPVKKTVILGPYSEHPYRGSTTDLAILREKYNTTITAELARANNGAVITPDAKLNLNLGGFIEQSYFPRLQWRLTVPDGNELHIEPSTVESYEDIFKGHVKDHPIAKIKLRTFTARDAQRFIEGLPQLLAHKTHLRIKNFLSGVFTWALADGVIVGTNPMDSVKAGGRKKSLDPSQMTVRQRKIKASNEHAYTLEEVADMLDKLPEPARTVCAVAAFTGLTRSELRGLKWEDYDGKSIQVRRKIWEGHVGAPKTEAREAGIFVMPLLRKILAKYKKDYPQVGDGWVFRGEKLLRPLDLDNLSRREIPKHINGAWFGWHAFRRGLGTRLNEAGVDDTDIQSILRHADISTTQAYYILPSVKNAEAGMRKLGAVAQKKYGIRV